MHIFILKLCFLSYHLMNVESSFGFQHCEHSIQTNTNKEPEILLWCQSNDKYKYCSVGVMTGDRQAISKYCKFQKFKGFTKQGSQFLRKDECDPDVFTIDIWYGGIIQTDLDCQLKLRHFKIEDTKDWFMQLENDDGNSISKIFYSTILRDSLAKVKKSVETQDICKHLKIESPNYEESIKMPRHPIKQETSNLVHTFEYQFSFENKPAYKHSDGQHIYLYWSAETGAGEWILGTAIQRKIVIARSACREKFPQNCDELWENDFNRFKFKILCENQTQSENEIQNNGEMELMIGIVAATFSFALFLMLGTIYYYKMKRRTKADDKSQGNNVNMNELQTSRCIPIHAIAQGDVPIPSQEEFDKLICFDNDITQRITISQGERYNDKKYGFNRVPQNIPFDHNRLSLKNPIEQCDYINANKISPPSDERTYDELIYTSYQPFKSIQWAVGQNPLPQTMNHHFRLIHENRFDTIMGFTEKPSETLFKSGNKYRYEELELKILKQTQINDHLLRTDFTISSDSLVGYEYKHYASYFEFSDEQREDITNIESTDKLLSSLCAIRNEMKGDQTSTKVFVHDHRGGVGNAALSLVLYEVMEQIDTSFTEDNRVKNNAPDIDVFPIVNRLRKDRAKMIEDYITYKLIFYCIGNYGKNRLALNDDAFEIIRRNQTENETTDQTIDASHVLVQNEPESPASDNQVIEYVMHESDEQDRRNSTENETMDQTIDVNHALLQNEPEMGANNNQEIDFLIYDSDEEDHRNPTENETMDQTIDASHALIQNEPEMGAADNEEIEFLMYESDEDRRNLTENETKDRTIAASSYALLRNEPESGASDNKEIEYVMNESDEEVRYSIFDEVISTTPTENEKTNQMIDTSHVLLQNDPENGAAGFQEKEYAKHESDEEDRYSIFDEIIYSTPTENEKTNQTINTSHTLLQNENGATDSQDKEFVKQESDEQDRYSIFDEYDA